MKVSPSDLDGVHGTSQIHKSAAAQPCKIGQQYGARSQRRQSPKHDSTALLKVFDGKDYLALPGAKKAENEPRAICSNCSAAKVLAPDSAGRDPPAI